LAARLLALLGLTAQLDPVYGFEVGFCLRRVVIDLWAFGRDCRALSVCRGRAIEWAMTPNSHMGIQHNNSIAIAAACSAVSFWDLCHVS
jgi:hypothetical protein